MNIYPARYTVYTPGIYVLCGGRCCACCLTAEGGGGKLGALGSGTGGGVNGTTKEGPAATTSSYEGGGADGTNGETNDP